MTTTTKENWTPGEPTPHRRPCDDFEQMVMESAALGEASAPTEIFIAPWGEVRTTAGSFVLDEQAAAETIAAFEAHGTDLPVDYEHQTLGGPYSSPSGQAPAGGWIKSLSVITPQQASAEGETRPAGLWARVEWTSDAARKLTDRHYRYLSPVALVRRSDRRLIALHSVALTNKPAIAGMKPLVHSASYMAPKSQRPVPINSRCAPSDDATARLRIALHMDDAPDEVLLVAAADRILLLENREAQRIAEARVAAATGAGKLTTAQRDWAIDLALRDPVEFDRWEQAAPVLVPLGRLVPPRSATARTHNDLQRGNETAARAEWHANRAFLEKLCTLEAYIAGARRHAET